MQAINCIILLGSISHAASVTIGSLKTIGLAIVLFQGKIIVYQGFIEFKGSS
jgi:hypothetical protein